VSKTELFPFELKPPPAPTVTVYDEPGVTASPEPVLNPPAPPPPPPLLPPPPPPAITRYSTSVTPAGAVHVVDATNDSIIVVKDVTPVEKLPNNAK
jgi:hypothetical protein